MVNFEGNINGKVYTDEKEFFYDLSKLNKTDDMYVSYRYVSVPDTKDEPKLLENKNNNITLLKGRISLNYPKESSVHLLITKGASVKK